jgi:cytochrome c oxidase subunit IV
MNDHPHDMAGHVRGYLIVGAALMIGTLLTVWASYIDLGHHWNIVLALVIATTKASLVALFFMHLISERAMIYTLLGFTAFFFAGLMFLTIGASADFPPLTTTH